MAQKKVPAPFKPSISSDLDTSNFADEFTRMPADYSPAATPAANTTCPFKVCWPLKALIVCSLMIAHRVRRVFQGLLFSGVYTRLLLQSAAFSVGGDDSFLETADVY